MIRTYLYTHLRLGAVFLLLFLSLGACQERMVCPAYQSTFILNDSVREERFSLFQDSLPKPNEGVEKTVFGLIARKTRAKKLREMRTIDMKNILPPKLEPDSMLVQEKSLEELNRMRDELDQSEEGSSNQK